MSTKKTRNTISVESIDKILKFLPIFEQENYEFAKGTGGLTNGELILPVYTYSEEVYEFESILYKEGFIYSFDWPKWQEEAARYFYNPEVLKKADLQTMRKLFTTHIRKERFCDGHLLEVLKSGHINNILRRLKQIRQQMSNRH